MGPRLVEYLYGLAELATYHNRDGFSVEMGTFLAESIEYAAVRVALALDGPQKRIARYGVALDTKAVAS